MLTKKRQINLALKFWWFTHWVKRLGNITPFRQIGGLVTAEKACRGSFIPIREDIEVPPGVVAPRDIIRDFISRASQRTISNVCPCRTGQGCTEHPHDLGCILLGDAAKTIGPDVGRSATVEEALEYADMAIARGLLPMIGHMRVDSYVYGAKPFNRLVTVCFCCDCCCVFRSEMHHLKNAYPDSMVRLDGVRVEAEDWCTGCGECLPVCPVGNISMNDGVASIGEMCLGCGNCVDTCPEANIKMFIEPGSRMLDDLRRRVEAGVEIE